MNALGLLIAFSFAVLVYGCASGQEPSDRRPTNFQPSRDLGLVHLRAGEPANLLELGRCRARPPELAALESCRRNAIAHALRSELVLELGEHGEHARHCASCRRSEVDGLGDRHEWDLELEQLLQRRDEVCERAPPSVELPDDDDVDLATSRSLHHELAPRSRAPPRQDVILDHCNAPLATRAVGAELAELHWDRLLVGGRNPGVDRGAQGVAKNLAAGGLRNAGV